MRSLSALAAVLLSSTAALGQIAGVIDAGAAPYNMKCDGQTDDSKGFSDAATAAALKTLSLPGGNWCMVDPQAIIGHITPFRIQGNGTMLVARNPSPLPTLTISQPPLGFSMDGVRILSLYKHAYALKIDGLQNASITNVRALGATAADIWIRGTLGLGRVTNNTFSNVSAESGLGIGWLVQSDNGGDGQIYVSQNACINCRAARNPGGGAVINGANGLWNISFEGNGGVDLDVDHSADLTFSDGHADANSNPSGISLRCTASSKGIKWRGGQIAGILTGACLTDPTTDISSGDAAGNKLCIRAGAPC